MSNRRALNTSLTAFLMLATVMLLTASVHLSSAGSSTGPLSTANHDIHLRNQPGESSRFTSISAGSGNSGGMPTPTKTPTPTPTCTPLPKPTVSIDVNPKVVNVGDTLVVTGVVTHMGLTYWALVADSGKIAHLQYNGPVFFYDNSRIVQAISGRGGHSNASATLKAKSPGTVILRWDANGETGAQCQGWYLTHAWSAPVTVTVIGAPLTVFLPVVVFSTSPP